MSKAKVKVTVRPVKNGSGTLIAKMPVTITKNDNPNGKKLYQTNAHIGIRVQTTRNGQPRKKVRNK